MNTIGSDGDLHLVPVNMQTLERAAKEPEKPESAPPGSQGPATKEPVNEPGAITEGDDDGRN